MLWIADLKGNKRKVILSCTIILLPVLFGSLCGMHCPIP